MARVLIKARDPAPHKDKAEAKKKAKPAPPAQPQPVPEPEAEEAEEAKPIINQRMTRSAPQPEQPAQPEADQNSSDDDDAISVPSTIDEWDGKDWEIEDIRGCCVRIDPETDKPILTYYCKWEDWHFMSNTYEPLSNMGESMSMVHRFHRDYREAIYHVAQGDARPKLFLRKGKGEDLKPEEAERWRTMKRLMSDFKKRRNGGAGKQVQVEGDKAEGEEAREPAPVPVHEGRPAEPVREVAEEDRPGPSAPRNPPPRDPSVEILSIEKSPVKQKARKQGSKRKRQEQAGDDEAGEKENQGAGATNAQQQAKDQGTKPDAKNKKRRAKEVVFIDVEVDTKPQSPVKAPPKCQPRPQSPPVQTRRMDLLNGLKSVTEKLRKKNRK